MATPPAGPFTVYGLQASYFTRKVTGYLDLQGIPWRLDPGLGLHEPARAAGWNGGLPVITTDAGELIWDSTAVLLHLDSRFGDPEILPQDPALAFLVHVLEDFSDEWFYRPAVGTRWLWPENTVAGSWDIARDGAVELGLDAETTRGIVTEAMTASLYKLGTDADNIDSWVDHSVKPWQRAMSLHLEQHRYLVGDRPSLADLAFFGGNVAHFANDPACRRFTDADASAVVDHTHRLRSPWAQSFGEWLDIDALPDSFLALLAEAGRHYLPWVAEATTQGRATVTFEDGKEAIISSTPFLDEARRTMLARYVEARSPVLDAVLERAGILPHFRDHVDQAGSIPDPVPPPRPAENRPYPSGP